MFTMPAPKKPFNPYPPLDRDALHVYLWERSSPVTHRITIHQGDLAEGLNVTRGTIVRVINEMADQGRLKKVEAKKDNVRVYQITDPAVWSGDKPVEPRKIRWG